MRALRSRRVSDIDNNKSKKSKKKHSIENSSSVESEVHETSVENDEPSKKLKKKKSKKVKRETLSVNTQSTDVETEISDNQKLDNSTNEIKKKKSKKVKRETSSVNTQSTDVETEISDNQKLDNSTNEVKKKKSKKVKKEKDRLSVNTQSTDAETEVSDNQKLDNSTHEVKKKKSKKVKKEKNSLSVNTNSTDVETEVSDNQKLDNSTNEGKKKKSKKEKKEKDSLSVNTQSTEVETETFDTQKLDNSTNEDKKKKSKKKRKSKMEIPENSNENDEETTQIKKKSKKERKSQDEDTQSKKIDNFLSISTDIKEDIIEPAKGRFRKLRSTILSSPNFNNAVTSTVIKPKRPQFNDITEEVSASKKRLTKQKRISETEINDSNITKSRRSSSRLSSNIVEENEDTSKNSRRSSLGKSLKTNKIPHIQINNVTASIIAISDSPDISKIKRNTFNKSESPSEEDTLKENSNNRRETFNILPKNKYLIEESVITITDTPDKTVKRNTFNKSEREIDRTFDISNKSSRKSNKSDESTLKEQQSVNKTTSINNTTRKSSLSAKSRLSGLSNAGESILESSIIDITESPDKIAKVVENNINISNKKNNTYEIDANTSGDWKIEQKTDETLNKTENKENHKTPPKVKSLSPKDQSIRKKWLKFPRHSTDAKILLEQISSPRLQKKMNAIMNTPKELYSLKKSSIAPINLSVNKSTKKSPIVIKKSPMKSAKKSIGSTKKSATKRTVMPNFALIHQKAFEKMENLKEYSERKQQRAQALLSSKKPESTRKTKPESIPEEPKLKSSRQLFTKNEVKYNRFGFKMTENKPIFSAKPEPNVALVKPIIKPSIFSRPEVAAVANKKLVTTTTTNKRDNRRDMLKGVRTNRRFELLMQMRNK